MYPCNVCDRRFRTDRGRLQHEYNCAAKALEARRRYAEPMGGLVDARLVKEYVKKEAL